jgi:hypothetical protein
LARTNFAELPGARTPRLAEMVSRAVLGPGDRDEKLLVFLVRIVRIRGMDLFVPRQALDPERTAWHITFGTYGTRLHGGARPTVDKRHNRLHEPFVGQNKSRAVRERGRMKFPARYLSYPQRSFVEDRLPIICERGGWNYRVCAAGPDHVHLLCDILPAIHGERVRRLVKRWLGQALSESWSLPSGASWWAEEGSNKAIHDDAYLNNAFVYILRQRTTRASKVGAAGGEDTPAH